MTLPRRLESWCGFFRPSPGPCHCLLFITHIHVAAPTTTNAQAASANGAPGRLELVAADITQPATLLPEMFEGVSAVVNASAVKVAPKEGDTPDRAKYLQVLRIGGVCLLLQLATMATQGIKFFDPEIVGDTPETVEYRGMQNLMGAVRHRLGLTAGRPVFDPANKEARTALVNFAVMRAQCHCCCRQ